MKTVTTRASLIIRCSRDDAARIRAQAAADNRSVSGYLLHMMERSIWVEDRVARGLTKSFLAAQAHFMEGRRTGATRTAIHLRCSSAQADAIRGYAARRQLSISDFVMFSLWRDWDAVARLQQSPGFVQTP